MYRWKTRPPTLSYSIIRERLQVEPNVWSVSYDFVGNANFELFLTRLFTGYFHNSRLPFTRIEFMLLIRNITMLFKCLENNSHAIRVRSWRLYKTTYIIYYCNKCVYWLNSCFARNYHIDLIYKWPRL